jgi:hypothetical protein
MLAQLEWRVDDKRDLEIQANKREPREGTSAVPGNHRQFIGISSEHEAVNGGASGVS